MFLCTGNYYRSRFAENLFNAIALKRELNCSAQSRGLAENIDELRNPGPMSVGAISGLKEREVPLPAELRFPMEVTAVDFRHSDRIIVLDESEHRPMLLRRFPEYENSKKVEYWDVPDLDRCPVDTALYHIENNVYRLVERLLLQNSDRERRHISP
jgi:protein-tyrosine phosphatase